MVNWLLTWGKTLGDWEGSTGNAQEPSRLISLQTIFFVSQTLIERMDECAFLLSIFPSWGLFLLPRKTERTLGTKLYWWVIRDLTIRQRAKPMKMSLKNWLHVLWIFFAVIPSQPVTWWFELKRGDCVRDQRGIVVYHLAFLVLKSTKNLVISSRRSCAQGRQRNVQKSVMQECWFDVLLIKSIAFFDVPVAISIARIKIWKSIHPGNHSVSRYLTYALPHSH